MNDYDDTTPADDDSAEGNGEAGMSLTTFTRYFREIHDQPPWRKAADREMEYVDGNQLDSEILRKQRAIGLPPAIEPLIGPAIDTVLGLEAKTRTDWRVIADTDKSGEDVALALNQKLNQAERHSKADQACSDAFKSQLCVGIGWVEVSRDEDPFRYPYRCTGIHRNEIWWDFLSKSPDLSDARYLIRRRWVDNQQVMLKYPDQKDLINQACGRWTMFDGASDGATSTDLAMSFDQERGWSVEDQEWRNIESQRVCLFEVWYRIWVSVLVLKTPDGRVVEYDAANPMHTAMVASGAIKAQRATVGKMRMAMWMGPHKLSDEASPYRHGMFPYAPFWGKREDRTNVPYGLVRGMMYMQDNVNATQSKIRWGLSAVRTTRTDGAVVGTDEQFRGNVSRIDADIVLDPDAMAKPGAVFKVERDFQLNEQHYKMLNDSRIGIQRTSGIQPSLGGASGSATSGVQEATQVEQATQSLADMMDNFRTGRAIVGELLISLLIEDVIGKAESVKIDGKGLREDRDIALNRPERDEDGMAYLSNDVERTKLKVDLQEVPSTSSFRAQQLAAMSEAFKSMPPQYQSIALPHLLSLMDVPDKDEIIKEVRDAGQQTTPEQVKQQIDAAVQAALQKSGADLKARELDLKYAPELLDAQVRKLVSEAFKTNVEALYSANQTAASLVMNPAIAPVADEVARVSGYQAPSPVGMDPNLPIPQGLPMPVGAQTLPGVVTNTSPQLPPVPQMPAGPGRGIETLRTSDN